MKNNIDTLYKISKKKSRIIIGLMSGTSLDGLDIACCKISNYGINTKIQLIHFSTIPYNIEFKHKIKCIFSVEKMDSLALTSLNEMIGIYHAKLINKSLKKWGLTPKNIDLIASHGQTIFHAPKHFHKQKLLPNCTLQIGDGDHIAVNTGIITISDFRQKHIALGGEGAPLALYLDQLFIHKNENNFLLNIGGIANLTFIPSFKLNKKIISTDVGPGNTLLDQYTQKYFNKQFDKNAAIALKGTINIQLLNALKEDIFFKQKFPKSTGPELFNLNYLFKAQKKSNTIQISKEDVLATLNMFSADCIIDFIKFCSIKNAHIYASGGGFHNPLLLKNIASKIPHINIVSSDKLNLPPDAKEAILMAFLANETVVGKSNLNLGKISFPN